MISIEQMRLEAQAAQEAAEQRRQGVPPPRPTWWLLVGAALALAGWSTVVWNLCRDPIWQAGLLISLCATVAGATLLREWIDGRTYQRKRTEPAELDLVYYDPSVGIDPRDYPELTLTPPTNEKEQR